MSRKEDAILHTVDALAQQSSLMSVPPRFPVKIRYFSNALALCCVDFPIFYIESISERHIIIAGGGGSSNTGVHNQINVLELIPTDESCAAELVLKYRTPKDAPYAIMNGSLMIDSPSTDTRFVTCGDRTVIIYDLSFELDRRSYTINDYTFLNDPRIEADIDCVKYATGGRILTGGHDGQLTVWNVNISKGTNIETSFKAHTEAIDEIDINLMTGQIITLSRDEDRAIMWDLKSCKMIKEFGKDMINLGSKSTNANLSIKYKYRSCRFAYDTTTSGTSDSCLLIACNPSSGFSQIYKWSTKNDEFRKIDCQPVTKDGISALQVSKDGDYVAIGTRSGGVAVFDVKTLREIYKLDSAHHNAVTRLEFLPPKHESLTLTNSRLCPLLSVSIDRQLILHRPGRESILYKAFKMLLWAIISFLAFLFVYIYYPHESSSTAIENKATNNVVH